MSEEESGGEAVQATVIELFIKAIDEMTEPMEEAGKSLKGIISTFKEAAIAAGEIFVAKEAFESIIEPAAAMHDKMIDLSIATGKSVDQLEEFKETAEKISTTYGISAEAMIDAQTTLFRAFGDTEKALEASTTVAKYALVTHQNATQAAQGLAEAYNAIGDKSKPFAEGLEDVANRLTFLQTKFNLAGISAEQFGRMFMDISGEASKFHVPMDQLESMVAVLSRAGNEGGRALQAVRETIDAVFGGRKGFAQEWSKAGLWIGQDSTKDLINFIATVERADRSQHALFEQFAQSHGRVGILLETLAKHAHEWDDATKDLRHTQGLLDKDAEEAAKKWSTIYNNFVDAIGNIADAIGTPLLPALTAVTGALTEVAAWITELDKAHPWIADFAAGIVGLFAVLLTLVAGIELVVAAFGMLSTGLGVVSTLLGFLISGPVLVAMAAIAAFGYLVYDNWTTVVRIWEWGVKQVYYLMDWWNRFVNDPWDVTRETWEAGKSWLVSMMDSIGAALSFAGQHPLEALIKAWHGIQTVMLAASAWLSSWSLGAVGAVGTLVMAIIGPWGTVAYITVMTVALIIDNWSKLVAWFKAHLPEVSHAAEEVADYIARVFNSAASAIVEAWQSVKQAFSEVFDWLDSKIGWIADKFSHLAGIISSITHLGGLIGEGGGGPGRASPSLPGWGIGPVPQAAPAPAIRHESFLSGSRRSDVTYAPVMHVAINASGGPEEIREQISQAMADERERFRQMMADEEMDSRRTTFQPLVFNT